MIYGIHAFIALCAFVLVLNPFLNGAYKAHIDAAFGVGWLTLVALAFWISSTAGWVALGMSFVYGAALKPLASNVAWHLLNRKRPGRDQ